jgi:hypothetical protein
MPRGIAWDDLPNPYLKNDQNKPKEITERKTQADIEREYMAREFNYKNDLTAIGRRAAFGVAMGGITGACFGFVEVLRNTKLMTGKRNEATSKILGFTGRFAGSVCRFACFVCLFFLIILFLVFSFFGFYHGMRKGSKIYLPITSEQSVGVAAISCVLPMIVLPTFRPMIPYALAMIVMDVVNGVDDV